jgi:hypothetical protein
MLFLSLKTISNIALGKNYLKSRLIIPKRKHTPVIRAKEYKGELGKLTTLKISLIGLA